jgi:ABC-type sugar transport system ATPase subunit
MGEAIYKEGRSLIKVENVSLILGGNQILKDVNAEIKDLIIPGQTIGQVVGFLGPSGIGKTKLFEVMAGLINPTSGQVLINGKPVKVGDLGVVQQNYPLFNHQHSIWAI